MKITSQQYMINISTAILIILLFSILSDVAFAEGTLGGIFLFKTDSDLTSEEYVEIEGRLSYTMDLPRKMKVRIAIEASLYGVNPHELIFRFGNPGTHWIRRESHDCG